MSDTTTNAAVDSAVTAPPAAGWTRTRLQLGTVLMLGLLIAAFAALWAMKAPWVGPSVAPGAEPTCQVAADAVLFTTNADGTPAAVQNARCWSAEQSLQLTPTGVLDVGNEATFGRPGVPARMGLPSATAYLLASIALGLLALSMRNSLILLPTLLLLNASHRAFTDTVTAMSWEMKSLAVPMAGQVVHVKTFYATVGMLLVAMLLIAGANAAKRRAEVAAFKAGERENLPGLVTLQLIAGHLVRGNLEKLSDVAEAAKESAKTGKP